MNSYVNDNKVCSRMAQIADIADLRNAMYNSEYKMKPVFESDEDRPAMAFDVFVDLYNEDIVHTVFDNTQKQLELLQKEKDKYLKLRNKFKGAYM